MTVAFCTLALIALLSLGAALARHRQGAAQFAAGGYLALFGLCLSLALAELYTWTFAIQSDAYSITAGNREWWARYWQPFNSKGYRDKEWSGLSTGKRLVAFSGDSFIAGAGINSHEDRLPEKVERQLGKEWQSVVLAKVGWGPREEARALADFPRAPDVTVLSFFANDIEDAHAACGRSKPVEGIMLHSPAIMYIEQRSLFFSLLYWRWWRARHPEIGEHYWQVLMEGYRDPACRTELEHLLDNLVDTALARTRAVIALIYPELTDPARSEPAVQFAKDLFVRRRIPILEVEAIAGGLPLESRLANMMDPHPGPELNARIAEKLAEMVKLAFRERARIQ